MCRPRADTKRHQIGSTPRATRVVWTTGRDEKTSDQPDATSNACCMDHGPRRKDVRSARRYEQRALRGPLAMMKRHQIGPTPRATRVVWTTGRNEKTSDLPDATSIACCADHGRDEKTSDRQDTTSNTRCMDHGPRRKDVRSYRRSERLALCRPRAEKKRHQIGPTPRATRVAWTTGQDEETSDRPDATSNARCVDQGPKRKDVRSTRRHEQVALCGPRAETKRCQIRPAPRATRVV